MSCLPGNRFPIGWRRAARWRGGGAGPFGAARGGRGRWHVGRREGARGRGNCPAGLGSGAPGTDFPLPGTGRAAHGGLHWPLPPAWGPESGRHSAGASLLAGKDHLPTPGLSLAKGPSCGTAGGDLKLQGFVANETDVPVAALQPFGYQLEQTGMTKFPSPCPEGVYCPALSHRLIQRKKENKSAQICRPAYIQN